IARMYNTTVSELKALNNLRSDLILIGQNLKVNSATEVSKETPSTPSPAPSTPLPSSSETYTVKSGDTLSHVAVRYGMSVSEFRLSN
ncbi:MAG TPA: LysM peptidoglycan-binding domain-containing protein, partial [Atopostipes sp.]|nr:LysM peptidoglycan-binding domain-containing protein [Atopostipes sp.]